ncbi:MAG: 2-hydroxyacid dehydrogenase [Proteobacteria bacterium]|jgi:Lactate dehydrogenase and related dehydrogenases|nr:MAG: 2-hydroxyacid dehydrogenase [Pseudomonadota bacterium]
MAKPALLMTGRMMPLIEEQLDQIFDVHRLKQPADLESALAAKGDVFEAICTGAFTGVKVDDALMARLPKLRIIGNFGVGYDSVDAAAAGKRGIIVTNTPDVLTEEVADTTLGLLLMTVRELSQAERWLREGKWAKQGEYRLTPASLRDRSVGLLGMGRIGMAIARRLEAFGLPVSYHTRRQRPELHYTYYPTPVELAKAVDTLIVITPGGPETKNIVNAVVLEALGPRGVLINMARGTCVDEAALIQALRNGTIHAAGLDVFLNEPNINPELLTLPNAVLLPHVGSASVYTRNKMGQLVVDNLKAYAERKPPLTPVPETPFNGW